MNSLSRRTILAFLSAILVLAAFVALLLFFYSQLAHSEDNPLHLKEDATGQSSIQIRE